MRCAAAGGCASATKPALACSRCVSARGGSRQWQARAQQSGGSPSSGALGAERTDRTVEGGRRMPLQSSITGSRPRGERLSALSRKRRWRLCCTNRKFTMQCTHMYAPTRCRRRRWKQQQRIPCCRRRRCRCRRHHGLNSPLRASSCGPRVASLRPPPPAKSTPQKNKQQPLGKCGT